MTQRICTCLWRLSEFLGVRCPFALWVFGKMIGAKGRKKP